MGGAEREPGGSSGQARGRQQRRPACAALVWRKGAVEAGAGEAQAREVGRVVVRRRDLGRLAAGFRLLVVVMVFRLLIAHVVLR